MKTKYALVDNIKREAFKGAKGICQYCGSELIAKCGDIKINHWAHKGIRNCDTWWENETEWHRAWKGNFSSEWQEVIFTNDHTGERHIADIQTAHGLVLEFQHSHIDPIERVSREQFYKNMLWVVDGTRLKRDFPRFLKAKEAFRLTKQKGIFLVDNLEDSFPSAWNGSSVPVIFDFKGTDALNGKTDLRNNLYCLFQLRQGKYSHLAEIPREAFIRTIINGDWTLRCQSFIESIKPKKEESIKKQDNTQSKTSHRHGTHYYDQKKGKFLKRRRF